MWDVSLDQTIRKILNADKTRGGWPRFNWLPVAIALVVLIAWYLLTLDSAAAFIVASPGAVARQFVTTLLNGTLLKHIGTTLLEIGLGFVLGVVCAFVLGYGIARSRLLEQALGPAVGVDDRERLLDPRADLFGGAKASGLDLVSQLLLLGGGEFPPVSFVLEGTEGLQAARAVQFQPVPEGPGLDVEQLRHFGFGAALIEPEEGQHAAGDPVITLVPGAFAHVLPLLRVQPEPSRRRFHRRRPLGCSPETEL